MWGLRFEIPMSGARLMAYGEDRAATMEVELMYLLYHDVYD